MENILTKYLGFEENKPKNNKKENDKNKKPKIEIKHPGAFTKWCIEQGFEGVTCECICKALETDDPVLHKRAIFANNFGIRKKLGKDCECVKKWKDKNKKNKKRR